jgi:protein-tyrosine phosphatase
MRRHAELHGYNITHRSRPIKPSDFNHFDLILGMDPSNIRELLSRASEANRHKIKLLGDYCQQHTVDAIPDPYLGVDKDFEYVIELVEDACAGLLLEIESNGEHTRS